MFVFVDIKKHFFYVHFYIDFGNHGCMKKPEVAIDNCGALVRLGDNNYSFKIQSLSFTPAVSCKVQHVSESLVTFKAHLARDVKPSAKGDNESELNPISRLTNTNKCKHFESKELSCSCITCGNIIFYPQPFSRVLPLPSSNWYDMTDNVFCHLPSPATSSNDCAKNASEKCDPKNKLQSFHKSVTLKPRQGDFLVGDSCVLMHKDSVLKDSFTCKKTSLLCRRCHQKLGQTLSEKDESISSASGVFLYEPMVKFCSTSGEQVLHLWTEDCLEYLLSRLIMSIVSEYSCRRFLVLSEKSTQKVPFALLWIMDLTGNVSSTTADCKEISLAPWPIVRVLFQDCLREKNKSLVECWEKDLTVQSVPLPSHICSMLLDILIKSNNLLPETLTFVNGFFVGFLKKGQQLEH